MSYVFVDITANRVERHHNGLQLAEMTAPSSPSSGWGHLYAKTDGKIYFKNDGGTEYNLTTGAGGTVTSVSGTANRISSTGGTTPVIDIDAAYVGQTSITTLGTVTTGTWSATAIARNKIAALTANRALVTDGSGFDAVSAVTDTELGYLSGVTSAVQTQLATKGYTLILTGSQGTFVDGSTYYSGAITSGTGTTAAINRVYIPVSGTITDIVVYQLTAGTLASGESSSLFIRYDNTTDVTISTSVLNTGASEVYSAHGLSQAVTADHYIELKYLSASWGTNPTNVRWTCTVFIKS